MLFRSRRNRNSLSNLSTRRLLLLNNFNTLSLPLSNRNILIYSNSKISTLLQRLSTPPLSCRPTLPLHPTPLLPPTVLLTHPTLLLPFHPSGLALLPAQRNLSAVHLLRNSDSNHFSNIKPLRMSSRGTGTIFPLSSSNSIILSSNLDRLVKTNASRTFPPDPLPPDPRSRVRVCRSRLVELLALPATGLKKSVLSTTLRGAFRRLGENHRKVSRRCGDRLD